MDNAYKVSVLMPVYNTKEEWLRKAIESILVQSFRDFQFVIVLDCPTDGSDQVVMEYAEKDSRIQVISNDVNSGIVQSLNNGLKVCKGKYIARMDSDDISLPDRLQIQYDYMENNPQTAAVGAYICTIGASNYVEGRDYNKQDFFRTRMLFRNVGIPHPTAFMRKSILDEHGIVYRSFAEKAEDYQLWTELMQYGDIREIERPLLFYRIHANQISYENRKTDVIGSNNIQTANKQLQATYRVAIQYAKRLLDNMTEEDEQFHCAVFGGCVPNDDFKGYWNYLQKLITANDKKKLYDRAWFRKELKQMFCMKAFHRARKEKRYDMLFSIYMLKSLNFFFFSELFRSILVKKTRKKQLTQCMELPLFSNE